MGQTWTTEQQLVIDLRDKDILVSAAAGSGKTAVLVERIIKRITDEQNPVDIDRMLVVTFTKAAAAEMRERVSAAIDKKREENPENVNLIRQSSLIHNAMITTIDSFCLFVVRNHFEEINLDPNFRIADEGEMKLLKLDVMDEVFEEEFARGKEENADFFRLVDTYSGSRSNQIIKDMVLKLYEMSASSPWPKEWLAGLVTVYDAKSAEELMSAAIFEEIAVHSRQMLSDLIAAEQKYHAICVSEGGPLKYADAIAADIEMLSAATECKSYGELYEFFKGVEFSRFPAIHNFDGDEIKKNAVSDGRKQVKAEIEKIKNDFFAKPIEELLIQLQYIQPFAKELVRLTLSYLDKMSQRKRKKRIMDFGDIEHFALQILVDETTKECRPSAEEFRRHFDEIMIDEYQDSNQVQEAILQAISRESQGQYNMFMVGDVKQSIYRFRLACPELFMDKYKRYSDDDENHVKIDLHKNFRSRKEVLDFSNDVFYKIMQPDLGDVAYDDEAALYCGAAYEEEAGFETEVLLLDVKDELLSEQMADEELDKKQLEARLVGSHIRKLMATMQVKDKESGKMRPLKYSDIVILFRSIKNWGTVFAEVLEGLGIPAHVESSTGYFSAIEVQTVLNLLRILDNPYQDIPMAAVLRSPMVGLDDEELAQIKASNKELPFCAAAYEAMKTAEEGNLYEFYKKYKDLRRQTNELPIHELILKILSETGYGDYAASLPAGEKRAANLRMLVEKAIAYEKTSYKGLFHFVRYIDQLEKYDIDFGEADVTSENADVVHIMTIHKSKGLEFPVVFVSGLSKKFNMMDTKDKLVVHANLGMGLDEILLNPKRRRTNMIKTEIAEHMRREALGEELRVLYVALTRAKEKLLLTGVVEDQAKTLGKYTGNVLKKQPVSYMERVKANCYLDWLIPALLSYPEKYTIDFVPPKELLTESVEEQGVRRIAYEELRMRIEQVEKKEVEQFIKAFSYEYPYQSETDRKIKYSVSELKHMSMVQQYDSETAEAERPEFLLEEKESYVPEFAKESGSNSEEKALYGVSQGALRGTAVHRVMECMDFAAISELNRSDAQVVKQFVKDELERMNQSGDLPDDMMELVRPSLIEKFVTSEVALRMALAAKKGLLFKEKPFVMTHQEVLVQGIVDVFWMEEDSIVLLDYKTDRVKAAAELVMRYKTQLDLYADALTRIFSTEQKKIQAKESLIYSFALQEVVEV